MDLSQYLLDRLLAESLRARDLAHAPYSKYRVGVALLDEQGRIHIGANIENASYPQGWCAEPSALTAMLMAGGKQAKVALVTGPGPDRAFVFQQDGLMPWRTVEANVSFGLEIRGMAGDAAKKRAHDYIRLVGLAGFEQKARDLAALGNDVVGRLADDRRGEFHRAAAIEPRDVAWR